MANPTYTIILDNTTYVFTVEDIVACRENPTLIIFVPTTGELFSEYSFEEFAKLPKVKNTVKNLIAKQEHRPVQITIDGKVLTPIKSVVVNEDKIEASQSNSTILDKKDYIPKIMATKISDICALIPVFSGKKQDYVHFKNACDAATSLCDPTQIPYISKYIKTKLGNTGNNLPSTLTTWENFKGYLDEAFDKVVPFQLELDLNNLRQNSNESLYLYKQRTEDLRTKFANSADHREVLNYVEKRIKDNFVNGLRNELRTIVIPQKPDTVSAAYNLAVEEETRLLSLLTSTSSITEPKINAISNTFCNYCKRKSHMEKDCLIKQRAKFNYRSNQPQLSGQNHNRNYNNWQNGQGQNKQNFNRGNFRYNDNYNWRQQAPQDLQRYGQQDAVNFQNRNNFRPIGSNQYHNNRQLSTEQQLNNRQLSTEHPENNQIELAPYRREP